MKVEVNLNKLLIVAAVAITLAFVGAKVCKLINDKNEIINQLDKLVEENLKEKQLLKEAAQADSLQHYNELDSAKGVNAALKKKIVNDNNYYLRKLHALQKVNTYSARQHYADSLARTVR